MTATKRKPPRPISQPPRRFSVTLSLPLDAAEQIDRLAVEQGSSRHATAVALLIDGIALAGLRRRKT